MLGMRALMLAPIVAGLPKPAARASIRHRYMRPGDNGSQAQGGLFLAAPRDASPDHSEIVNNINALPEFYSRPDWACLG